MGRRDTSPLHATLLDRSGAVVRRCTVPRGATFLLNIRDGHYYDTANRTTFVQRYEPATDYLSVECPTCHAFAGWACGKSHIDPIHRARVVEALKANYSHSPTCLDCGHPLTSADMQADVCPYCGVA